MRFWSVISGGQQKEPQGVGSSGRGMSEAVVSVVLLKPHVEASGKSWKVGKEEKLTRQRSPSRRSRRSVR